MTKKFYNTRCVYCLSHFEALTSDHVFPKSWYPETTPDNLEKWQVPSCDKCNQKYSKLENELLLKFGLCVDPLEAKSLGIADKVLRSVKAGCAKSELDRVHRQKRLERTMQEMVPAEKIPKESVFPNFGPWPGIQPEDKVGILVSAEQLQLFGEKLVRGITYKEYSRYIEEDHIIEIFFIGQKGAQIVVENIRRFGAEYHCGPGIRVGVAFAGNDPQSGLFDIEIWGRLHIYATVLNRTAVTNY